MKPRLYFLMQIARHRLTRAAERECQRTLGVSATQLGALFVLKSSPGCAQRTLGEKLSLNDPAVTGLVGRMLTLGLITRERSTTDRRVWGLSLSKSGADIVRGARPLLAELNSRLTDDFTDDEVAVIARFLQTTARRFDTNPESK